MTNFGTPVEKYTRILAAHVVYASEVPLIAFTIGQPSGWRWDGNARGSYGRSTNEGYVYFGRRTDGATKVGFSASGAWRCHAQGLTPVLFVTDAENRQEKLLHELLAEDLIGREFFRGPRLDAFLAAACARSRSTVADWWWGSYFRDKVDKAAARARRRKAA